MKYIIYLFYKYYNNSRNTAFIAYESALIAISFLLFLNLFAVINFFNLEYLFSYLQGESKGRLYLILVVLFFLPVYLILSVIYKKSKVTTAIYEPSRVKTHSWFLLIYVVFSVGMLVFAIQYRNLHYLK
jgi:hypothetical protein